MHIEGDVLRTNYIRNTRAIGLAYAIFTICFGIISILIFLYPQWIGSDHGTVGPYRICVDYMYERQCVGMWSRFETIINDPFRAATFFIGISCLIVLLSLLAMVLFIFVNAAVVFNITGFMQLTATICLFLGIVIFPAGWNDPLIEKICGPDVDKYTYGNCSMLWPYILAILAVFDALVLTALAFILASRQAKSLPNVYSTDE
ncbi:hypothetical protein SNEBB_006754 [Seison nebaliae]|nr:hypothetical protein SNEBB_006754 [Seison nebaliae]